MTPDPEPSAKEPVCPQCGKPARLQSFGPFFAPDPVYRFAYECPDKHWRGTMGQSATEMLRARKEQP